jgi:hypothetical protein
MDQAESHPNLLVQEMRQGGGKVEDITEQYKAERDKHTADNTSSFPRRGQGEER